MLTGNTTTNEQVGALFQTLIQQGIAHLATYFSGRVQAGELRSDLPLETSAHVFFSSLIIFFVTYRMLDERAWEGRATTFIQEMLSAWFMGAHA